MNLTELQLGSNTENHYKDFKEADTLKGVLSMKTYLCYLVMSLGALLIAFNSYAIEGFSVGLRLDGGVVPCELVGSLDERIEAVLIK